MSVRHEDAINQDHLSDDHGRLGIREIHHPENPLRGTKRILATPLQPLVEPSGKQKKTEEIALLPQYFF